MRFIASMCKLCITPSHCQQLLVHGLAIITSRWAFCVLPSNQVTWKWQIIFKINFIIALLKSSRRQTFTTGIPTCVKIAVINSVKCDTLISYVKFLDFVWRVQSRSGIWGILIKCQPAGESSLGEFISGWLHWEDF